MLHDRILYNINVPNITAASSISKSSLKMIFASISAQEIVLLLLDSITIGARKIASFFMKEIRVPTFGISSLIKSSFRSFMSSTVISLSKTKNRFINKYKHCFALIELFQV